MTGFFLILKLKGGMPLCRITCMVLTLGGNCLELYRLDENITLKSAEFGVTIFELY